LKTRLSTIMLVLYQYFPLVNETDFVSVLTAKLVTSLDRQIGYKGRGEFAVNALLVWNKYRDLLALYVSGLEPAALDRFMNQVINNALGQAFNAKWQYQNGSLSSDSPAMNLDLQRGSLLSNEQAMEDVSASHARSWSILDDLHLRDKNLVLLDQCRDYIILHSRYTIVASPDNEWEFHYYSSGNPFCAKAFRNITVNDKAVRYQLLATGEGGIRTNCDPYFTAKSLINPFEQREYSYWKNADDEDELFVERDNYQGSAFRYTPQAGWLRLERDELGHWGDDGYLLLDLSHPRTDLERNWCAYLEKTVGMKGVTILAKRVNEDTLSIETMTWNALSLTFRSVNNTLECDEHPGFILTAANSVPCLSGLSCMVILENDKRERKYLIPPFSLNNKGDRFFCERIEFNAALNDEIFFNKNILLRKTCYEYHLDRDNELRGDDVTADLYLAMIYRSLGEYKPAMQCLQRSQDFKANQEEQGAIAKMTMGWPDQSPPGAAFDCQLMCRMLRHHRKWTSTKGNSFNITSSDLVRYTLIQYDYYQLNISEHREGISIIHHYLQLTEADNNLMRELRELQKNADIREAKASVWGSSTKRPLGLETVRYGVQLDDLMQSKRPWFLEKTHYQPIKSWFEELADSKRYHKQRTSFILSVRYYYDNNDVVLNREYCGNRPDLHPVQNPAKDYFFLHFVNLFEEALDPNPDVAKLLKLKLFTLLASDEKKETPVDIIHYVMLMRDHFKKYKGRFTSTYECIREVATELWMIDNKAPIQHTDLITLPKAIKTLPLLTTLPSLFPSQKQCDFNLTGYSMNQHNQYPFYAIMQACIEIKHVAVADSADLPFPVNAEASKMEKKLFARLHQGHAQNRTITKRRYTFLKPLIDIAAMLRSAKETEEERSRFLHDEILQLVNQYPINEGQKALGDYQQTLIRGQLRPKLTVSLVMDALLKQDMTLLQQGNAFLTQDDITALMHKICDYAVAQTAVDQCVEALEVIAGKFDLAELSLYHAQVFARTIDKQRHYNIAEFPEFLVYEYAAKCLLREDQAVSIIQLIHDMVAGEGLDFRHALLQFAAGGGKTSLIIPILCYIFARLGFLPVIFNTNELYNIGIHEIPQSLRNSLQQNVEVIERDLDHKWTVSEFDQLLQDIQQWHRDKKAILIKPVTWHSINSTKRIAYHTNEHALAKSALAGLKYLKKHAIRLGDEGHIQDDPLQQSIKTYGPLQPIPANQQQLLVDVYDYLLGYHKDSTEIAALAGMIEKSKKAVSPDELQRLKILLAEKMVRFNCYAELDHNLLSGYLLQVDRKKPEWLRTLRASQPAFASLVLLGRSFLQTLLPHVLTLQYQKDWGKSVHANDLTAAPKHDGKDVTSHFSDPMLIAVLTIQLYAIEGVPKKYLRIIIKHFETRHAAERRWNVLRVTQAEKDFNALLPDSYSFLRLDALPLATKKSISKDMAVKSSPAMQKLFLFTFALAQIKTPTLRVESTAADLEAGFDRSLLFTATPGLRQLYSACFHPKQYHELLSFEAEVVQTLLQPKNTSYCLLEMTHDPKKMFAEIHARYPDLFAKLQTLIERGALFSDIKPTAVANAILSAFDEVDERKTALAFEERDMVLQSKHAKLHNVKIPGSNIIAAIKRHGFDPKKLLVFLFLDLSKTTGTDVKRPHDDCAGITIGKGQTLSGTMQAVMRERQLLEDDAQSLIWLVFTSLYRTYSESEQFDLIQTLIWMVKNDAEELTTKIINGAYQGISQLITSPIWDGIDEGKLRFEEYAGRLEQRHNIDPYVLYEVECVFDEPNVVLTHFRDHLCKIFSVNPQRDLSAIQCRRLTSIIDETQSLVGLMREPHGAELNAQVCQEQQAVIEHTQEVEQEQKMKSLVEVGKDYRFNVERYSASTDALEKAFGSNYYRQLMFENCSDIRMPALLLNYEHFQPYESIMPAYTIRWLKPIQAVLVQGAWSNELQFVACTATGVQYFSDKMSLYNEKKVFSLVGFDGHIMCASGNATAEIKVEIEASPRLKEMLTFTAFLNGCIK
ncbi:MAG: DUF3638 domain-containing protein, partial [Pseudomonadota bacterium]|nr:DUF3638 domain-containing protein [Pseudomonadota bacterium]